MISVKLLQFFHASSQVWFRWLVLSAILLLALGYVYVNWEAFAGLHISHWEFLPLLAVLHLSFLAINGLCHNVLLEIFAVRLRPAEWFGLSIVTTLGSYAASSVGGMALRATILKRKFAVSYTQFMSLLTASYLLNMLLAAVVGLSAYAAIYAESGFWRWDLLVFFVATGGAAAAAVMFRPSIPAGSGRVRTMLRGIYQGWDILSHHPVVLAHAAALLALNFLVQAVTLIAGFAMFSVVLPFVPALLVAALWSFSIFVSLTPANLGVQEGIVAFLSHLVGYGFEQGLAVMVVIRVVSMAAVFAVSPFCSSFLLHPSPPAISNDTGKRTK